MKLKSENPAVTRNRTQDTWFELPVLNYQKTPSPSKSSTFASFSINLSIFKVEQKGFGKKQISSCLE